MKQLFAFGEKAQGDGILVQLRNCNARDRMKSCWLISPKKQMSLKATVEAL